MGKGTWPNAWASGVAASRPNPEDVGVGAYYYATDTGVLSQSDGVSAWTTVETFAGVAGGTDVAVADGGTGASTASAAATNLGLGTGDSPQFTAVNIGHASDTTLARASAGNLTVEGNALYRAGGTDVPIADGGTGASTKAAAFDALSPMTTQDDLIMGGASGTGTRLAKGTDGQVLTVDPTTHHLLWATPSSGFSDPMTTRGDIIIRNSSNATARLGRGSASTVLTSDGTDVSWQAPSGGSLTVEEVDGSPTDAAVTKIVFPNGTLGIASHVATYTPAGGSGASFATPTLVQMNTAGNAATSVSIAAAASGHTLVLFTNSTTGQVTSPTCTNVTWTQVLTLTSAGSSFYAIWIGVVAGGASGTSITMTKPGSFNTVGVLELSESVTPTTGVTTTGSSVTNFNFKKLAGGTAGRYTIIAIGQDNTVQVARVLPSVPAVGVMYGTVILLATKSYTDDQFVSFYTDGAGGVLMAEVS